MSLNYSSKESISLEMNENAEWFFLTQAWARFNELKTRSGERTILHFLQIEISAQFLSPNSGQILTVSVPHFDPESCLRSRH